MTLDICRFTVAPLSAMLLTLAPGHASLESARVFAHGMIEELQLEAADCPDNVLTRDLSEDHVCGKSLLPFRKFSQAWDKGAPRRAPRGVQQLTHWRRDYHGKGQQQLYEIQGTPLSVTYATRGKWVVISFSNYSWNEWPCPAEPYDAAAGVFDSEDARVTTGKRIAGTYAEYPELARVARQQGKISLEALIDEQGRVTKVCVRTMHHHDVGFERAAVDAVRAWRYEPATVDGRPVPVFLEVDISFKLH